MCSRSSEHSSTQHSSTQRSLCGVSADITAQAMYLPASAATPRHGPPHTVHLPRPPAHVPRARHCRRRITRPGPRACTRLGTPRAAACRPVAGTPASSRAQQRRRPLQAAAKKRERDGSPSSVGGERCRGRCRGPLSEEAAATYGLAGPVPCPCS